MSTSSSNQPNNSNGSSPNFISIETTAIPEYLEIMKSEYDIERSKKESFINRESILLALIGASMVMIFDEIDIHQLFILCDNPLTFFKLLNIISGFGVYLGLITAMISSLITLSTNRLNNFEVKNVNEYLLREQRIVALTRLIITYRDIIIQHRKENRKKASYFKISLISSGIAFGLIILYYLTC